LHEELTSAECKRVLRPLLDELKPVAVAIAAQPYFFDRRHFGFQFSTFVKFYLV
jgi:hypothetical protein